MIAIKMCYGDGTAIPDEKQRRAVVAFSLAHDGSVPCNHAELIAWGYLIRSGRSSHEADVLTAKLELPSVGDDAITSTLRFALTHDDGDGLTYAELIGWLFFVGQGYMPAEADELNKLKLSLGKLAVVERVEASTSLQTDYAWFVAAHDGRNPNNKTELVNWIAYAEAEV